MQVEKLVESMIGCKNKIIRCCHSTYMDCGDAPHHHPLTYCGTVPQKSAGYYGNVCWNLQSIFAYLPEWTCCDDHAIEVIEIKKRRLEEMKKL